MKLIVVDAGVWIRLARADYAQPLIKRFKHYKLVAVLNNYLLSEVHDALIKNKWATIKQSDLFVKFMKEISVHVTETVVYRAGPDPKRQLPFRLSDSA